MGIYLHHMAEVDAFYKRLQDDKDPDKLPRYKESMRKAFNHLLICLEMGEYDVSQPMTAEVCRDPYHPVT